MSSLTPSRRHLLALFAAALLALGLAACGNSENTPSVESTAATETSATTTTSGKSHFTVNNGAVKGYVDSAKVEGQEVLVTGWAASSNLSQPVEQAVVEVNGKVVTETAPTMERADVAAYYGKPALKHSGFLLRIPISALECSAPAGGVQVFGVLNGTGGRLALVEGSPGVLSKAC